MGTDLASDIMSEFQRFFLTEMSKQLNYQMNSGVTNNFAYFSEKLKLFIEVEPLFDQRNTF